MNGLLCSQEIGNLEFFTFGGWELSVKFLCLSSFMCICSQRNTKQKLRFFLSEAYSYYYRLLIWKFEYWKYVFPLVLIFIEQKFLLVLKWNHIWFYIFISICTPKFRVWWKPVPVESVLVIVVLDVCCLRQRDTDIGFFFSVLVVNQVPVTVIKSHGFTWVALPLLFLPFLSRASFCLNILPLTYLALPISFLLYSRPIIVLSRQSSF